MLNLKNLFNNQKQLNKCNRNQLNLKLKSNSQRVFSKLQLNQRKLCLHLIINQLQELQIWQKLDQEVHLLHLLEFLNNLFKKEKHLQMLLQKSWISLNNLLEKMVLLELLKVQLFYQIVVQSNNKKWMTFSVISSDSVQILQVVCLKGVSQSTLKKKRRDF